jgi:hypothetical protein
LRNFGVEGDSYLGGHTITGGSVIVDSANVASTTAGVLIGGGLGSDGNLLTYTFPAPYGTLRPRLFINGATYGTSHILASDRRLKKDIVYLDAESCLDKIKKLKGVTFKWKEGSYLEEKSAPLNVPFGIDTYGFIAQDVEEVLPNAVCTRKKPDGSEGLKAMTNDSLLPLLVEAIKAQQEQIETLRKDVENLKNS